MSEPREGVRGCGGRGCCECPCSEQGEWEEEQLPPEQEELRRATNAALRAELTPGSAPPAGALREEPQEYWRFRWLTTGLGLVSTVKGALTAQAHMIAIGVGDPDATPLNYLVISEINSALGRFIGLALAASVSSSYFAMHAKPTMVMNATVGKLGSAAALPPSDEAEEVKLP